MQSLGTAFLADVSLDELFRLCDQMLKDDRPESVELALEATGIIFAAIDTVPEKYFVLCIEMFQKYFEWESPGVRTAAIKEAVICSMGKLVFNCVCSGSSQVKCQPKWIESWLEGLPLKHSVQYLKEQIELVLSLLETAKDPIVSKIALKLETEPILKKILIVLLASAKRIPQDDLVDRIKEVLSKFNHSADNKRLLQKIILQLDDDARIKLSFLNVVG